MDFFTLSLLISISLLGIGLLVVLIRFIKGPTLPDRVSAFDLFSSIVMGIIAITAVLSSNKAYFDAAIVMSLISFLGAMSFAYYLNKGIKIEKNKKK